MKRAIEQLKKCKNLIKEFEQIYPDQDISNFKNKINEIETKYSHLITTPSARSASLCTTPSARGIDWDLVQKNYEKYCETFSPAYLSGSEWYFIYQNLKQKNSKHGNFKDAYNYCKNKVKF